MSNRRLITVSYTGLNAGGGVPKFNRDLHAAFTDRECRHFCWDDLPWSSSPDLASLSEWNRAQMLNSYLIKSRLISPDDVVVADGFWAKGLEHFPFAISHSHGIWSHLTHEDVLAGKKPDMPQHHAAQVSFRKRWTQLGKHLTAVSEFIAEQMRLQWGFQVDRVINNGVDTEVYRPREKDIRRRPLVLHGINDPANANKGFDHIERLSSLGDRINLMSLDQAVAMYGFFSPRGKPEALAQADLVVHPSGYEGNSMFVAESLACGVPVVGYDVGYLWGVTSEYPSVIYRSQRSPEMTLSVAKTLLSLPLLRSRLAETSRALALRDLSIDRFRSSWRSYVEEIENA